MSDETDLARMARIGDSVFAVVVTLLAYRVRIPSREALTGGQLAPLQPFLTDLAAVVMSFIVASMFWIGHWRVFRRLDPHAFGTSRLFLSTSLLMLLSGGAAIISLVWPAVCPALWSMAILVPLIENRWGLGRTV